METRSKRTDIAASGVARGEDASGLAAHVEDRPSVVELTNDFKRVVRDSSTSLEGAVAGRSGRRFQTTLNTDFRARASVRGCERCIFGGKQANRAKMR